MLGGFTTCSWLAALAIASSQAFAQGHGHAHVHGIASLQITVDGPTLNLRLRTPLENLVGFEHAPRTEQQKKALRDMDESLRRPESHFAATAAARCAPASTKIDSPFLAAAKGDVARKDAGGDKPRAAADTHGKEAGADAHAELAAEFVFRCEDPDRLQGVEVKLFDAYRKLRRVDVELAGPRGQKSYRLTSKSRVARW
ncbi:MAG: DUF2796 domain-containing protein [Betaproteobacteria bacterium]